MPRAPRVSTDVVLAKLREAGADGLTAAQVGVSTARLRAMNGVVVAGSQQTGRRGRPSLLFVLDD